jgi:hypothetical protein
MKSERMKWAGHVAHTGEKRNAYRIWVGKPEGKRPLGRSRHRWVNNIKMDLRHIEWGGMEWVDLVQDRGKWRALVNTVINLRVPLICLKFFSRRTTGGFSRTAQFCEVSSAFSCRDMNIY